MTLRFGAIEVRAAARQVFVDGQPGALGARAFDLLLALIERRERMVAKHELLDIVWPGLVVEENNLSVQVSALRKLLGPAAIATIPGRGYRFTAALEGDGDDRADRKPDSPAPADASTPASASAAAAAAAAVSAPASASAAAAPSAPAPFAPGNIAAHLAPLFGRDDDLRALLAQIEAHALVTLVGASGMGKTALAQAAAHALRERWRDGAWFVELAPVNDPAQLVQAVAQALRITLPAEASGQDRLVSVLGSMSLLLVLDNCEHLVEAAGALAEQIVTRAPGVRLLATSQELLNIPGEALLKLGPLALPAPDEGVIEATQFGAIRLFVERAQAGDPRFALSPDNAQAVADVCRRLDGLPLAIELAAARVRLLGVKALRDRLGERFRLLSGGARNAMRRHQTLHSALGWSHALLSGAEQTVFRRLGMFVGGFTLELAQQVAQDMHLDEWAVLDALSGLVDKSMVVADAAEPPRYRLLETTRAYALERLADAGETNAWIERHARALCELFERTEQARAGEQGTLGQVDFMRRLAPELDNARAALDWASAEAGVLNLAVGLAGAVAGVFINLGLSVEALSRLSGLQARIDSSVDTPRAALFWTRLSELGVAGRLPRALALDAADRAQRLYRASGARRRLFQALHCAALLSTMMGEWSAARALLPELSSLEDPSWPAWLRSDRLSLLGWIHHAQQHFEQAYSVNLEQQALLLAAPGEKRALVRCQSSLCLDLNMMQRYEESIALARSVIARERGEHSGSTAFLWGRLVYAQAFLGRIDDAWQTMRQGLPACRRDGAVFWGSGLMAILLAERGRWADAARVGAAGSAYADRADMGRMPAYQRMNARLRELLEAAPCTPADIELWQREGKALDEEAVAAICLREQAN